MTNSFVLQNVELADGTKTDIRVVGDQISEIGMGLKADEVLDCAGLIALPGFVDLHTHLREPGLRLRVEPRLRAEPGRTKAGRHRLARRRRGDAAGGGGVGARGRDDAVAGRAGGFAACLMAYGGVSQYHDFLAAGVFAPSRALAC